MREGATRIGPRVLAGMPLPDYGSTACRWCWATCAIAPAPGATPYSCGGAELLMVVLALTS
ncbi:MAG TPA: hypothetical protein VGL23_18440 [Chloroflexota bacterium]|jgi:hypothetical protein